MMKSFDNDRNVNPHVKTALVVRCLTPEVAKCISQGGLCDHLFGLSQIMVDDDSQRTFANLVLRTTIGR